MKKNLLLDKNKLIVVTFMIFIVGLWFDFLVKEKGIIIVSSDYINSIYASLVAISTLGFTVLTIIINSLSTKYYGFYIKEIINFKNDYFRISRAIPFIIFQVLLASFFVAIELVNVVCAILVIISFFIVNFSLYMWYIITDYDFSKKLTINYIKKSSTNNSEIMSKLFLGVNYYIEQNDLNELSNCIDIIIEKQNLINVDERNNAFSEQQEKSKDLSIISIDDYIKKSFFLAEKQYGLVIAIKEILRIYCETILEQDKAIKLIDDIVEKYQFVNDLEINSNEIVNIVNSLYTIDIELIDNNYKSIFIYRFFCHIYKNEIISDGLKKSLLDSLINKLMISDLDVKNNYYLVKQKALLYIFQDFILLNSNQNNGNYLMGKLSLALYNKAMFEIDKVFETVAIIYLILYLYSTHEKDSICPNQIEYIDNLVDIYTITINVKKIKFKSIISENFNIVLNALWNLDRNFIISYPFLEYFPKEFDSCSKVPSFTESALVDFSIYNYFLNWQAADFDFEISNFWELHKNDIKSILEMFNSDSKTFTEKTKKKIKDLSSWIDIEFHFNENLETKLYKKALSINSQMKISELDLVTPPLFDSEILNKELNRQFEINRFYGYSSKNNCFLQEKEYKFYFINSNKFVNNESELAQNLFYFYKKAINKFINDILPENKISFDIKGVKELFNLLMNVKYNNTNYKYINDLAFHESVIETTLFKQLREKIENLNLVDTPFINSRLYFDDNALDFKIDVISCDEIKLSQNEINQYLDRYKISTNIYNIYGAYVDRNKAINYINNMYSKFNITYLYKYNLSPENAFRIVFDHKSRKTWNKEV